MLRFDRKQQNSIKQLSFSKKINLKKKSEVYCKKFVCLKQAHQVLLTRLGGIQGCHLPHPVLGMKPLMISMLGSPGYPGALTTWVQCSKSLQSCLTP